MAISSLVVDVSVCMGNFQGQIRVYLEGLYENDTYVSLQSTLTLRSSRGEVPQIHSYPLLEPDNGREGILPQHQNY